MLWLPVLDEFEHLSAQVVLLPAAVQLSVDEVVHSPVEVVPQSEPAQPAWCDNIHKYKNN